MFAIALCYLYAFVVRALCLFCGYFYVWCMLVVWLFCVGVVIVLCVSCVCVM